jgi:hypothetical protein
MPLDSDAIGPSPRWKQYTTNGSTDLDFVADGGGPCRAIQLLSTGSGDLKLNQATPADPATPNAPITITNLPAGTPLNVQARGMTGSGSVNGIVILVLWCLALMLAGCTATEGRLVAAGLDVACQGGVVVFGDPGAAPLCVAPELVEKWIEALNPPTAVMGARAPITPAARYAAALAVGAKPIMVKP